MKSINAVKFTLFALLFSVLGFSLGTVPKVNAVFESIVGQTIDGPEFIQISSAPDLVQYVHKNEIAYITYNPTNDQNANKFTVTLKSNFKVSISSKQMDILLKNLDYTTIG